MFVFSTIYVFFLKLIDFKYVVVVKDEEKIFLVFIFNFSDLNFFVYLVLDLVELFVTKINRLFIERSSSSVFGMFLISELFF